MAIDLMITTGRISDDPTGRLFVEYLRSNSSRLNLDKAVLYYDFPTYSDYETVTHKPDALLLSPLHGVFAIRFLDQSHESRTSRFVPDVDESLTQFCSTLIGRFLKSKILRKGLSQVVFPVTPIIFVSNGNQSISSAEVESTIVTSLEGFDRLLEGSSVNRDTPDILPEARSVIEGAKALNRPKPRMIENPAVQIPALALSKLEAEIANFDEHQRRAALINVSGPQRIRGLAGSGKTVILAMKAAHLHLTNPNDLILVTFYTKSLRASLQVLITKFFRNFKEEDPDWSKIQIRHGWGGVSSSGTYADACRRHAITPMNFGAAQQAAAAAMATSGRRRERIDPFDYACRDLLKRTSVESYYDHILIDEGQDFPTGFYELCFSLVKGQRDAKNLVWAYDELQNILDIKIRSPEDLFGKDTDGRPRVSLARAARLLPSGVENDIVLSKCYRNQREVLTIAHALGFGIYGTIVQLLESRDHWEDVGYRVISAGEFEVGQNILIERPIENSPVEISQIGAPPLIESFIAADVKQECEWIVLQVKRFIDGGLQPEDIIVIVLDDRSSKTYFKYVSSFLAMAGISSNNITADPYNEPPFSIPGRVTLSTVYRAKGNEAAVVIASGVDAVALQSRLGRNKLFTAFTRTKAWLRISGMGSLAGSVVNELKKAQEHFPLLDFEMPDLDRIETIQRDLNQRTLKVRRLHDEYVKKLREEGVDETEVTYLLNLGDKDAEA